MNRIAAASLVTAALSSISAVQEKPASEAQIIVRLVMIETASDAWNDLREVDPAFKALGADVARLASGLEAEDIAARAKAAAEIKALGLSAYGAIKDIRDKASIPAVRAELEGVMASLAGESAKALAFAPSARKMGAKEGAALLKRLKDSKEVAQEPFMSVKDGTTSSAFVGDTIPVETGRVIKIPSGEGSVKVEKELSPQTRGVQFVVLGRVVDLDKRSVSLEITATALGPATAVKAEKVSASLQPTLISGQYYLAGPFPPAEDKGKPWWILVEAQVVKP